MGMVKIGMVRGVVLWGWLCGVEGSGVYIKAALDFVVEP